MQAPVYHVSALTTIIRERMLPAAGTVTARLNQKVGPTDIVADVTWAREHLLLDVARTLGVSASNADRFIKCKEGDRVTANAEIAVGPGMFSRVVRAPKDGKVILAGNGQVLLETAETHFELRAGIPGTVTQVIADRGVIIKTAGALIQGVWGNNRIETGTLVNFAEKPDTLLTAGRLDVSFRGSIILSAICKDAEALQAAAQLPVRGLILSSMSPSLLPLAREMRYPIMLTDGFGSMPMNSLAHKLLTTNAKRDVTLNAENYDRYKGTRPEAIIPLPISQEPDEPVDLEVFAAGQQVRMRRPPAMGSIASIVSIRPGLTLLPSGLRAPAADVKLENGETVVAPLVNLEVVR